MTEIADLQDRRLFTIGEIARQLDERVHRVKYAVDSYRIAPAGRVGILRVWSADALPLIKRALERIAANRGERL